MSKIKDMFKEFKASKTENLFEKFRREYEQNPDQELIIFGAGTEGRMNARLLKSVGIKPTLFWDNDVKKQGTHIMGIPVAEITPPPVPVM